VCSTSPISPKSDTAQVEQAVLREMRPEGFEPPIDGLENRAGRLRRKATKPFWGNYVSRILSLIADRCKRRDFLASKRGNREVKW
jgi:hypothetical protein